MDCGSDLEKIASLDKQLLDRFQDKPILEPTLTRALVSFQANKTRPSYRWYKYKEAFSAALVEDLLQKYAIDRGKILDPFAGSGTALFAASDRALDADGIELLPIGQQIIETRQLSSAELTTEDVRRVEEWTESRVWKHFPKKVSLPELAITRGAYPPETQDAIEQYLGAIARENESVRSLLRFALLCILESVSYTRKDGQYLRWDSRARRGQRKTQFNKGKILDFDRAIDNKIDEILQDLNLQRQQQKTLLNCGKIQLYRGSCLQVMPTLPDAEYSAIITSPPYCNRYDYTRTYALELALLGIDAQELRKLRQEMLSCTVENRPKDLLNMNPAWQRAIAAADEQVLLQTILQYLEHQRTRGTLNNAGIPRMIKGYFYEMACAIQEFHRVLQPNALLFMANDNVRYAGVSISVDTLLCDLAEKLGFCVENILVLPSNKGNSSQQMGNHGREPLRKCVYVWRKT